jgi:hypothetical protein
MKAANKRRYEFYLGIVSDLACLFVIYYTYIIADKTTSCKFNHITKYHTECNKIIFPCISQKCFFKTTIIFYAINPFSFQETFCVNIMWLYYFKGPTGSTIMFIQQHEQLKTYFTDYSLSFLTVTIIIGLAEYFHLSNYLPIPYSHIPASYYSQSTWCRQIFEDLGWQQVFPE